MLNVPIYGQRDSRWAGQRLGTCNETIGSAGCLITSIAMMDACFDPGNPWNPAQVNSWFTSRGGYANGCLVIWAMIPKLLPHDALQGFDSTPNTPAPIDKIKSHLNNGGLCILEVKLYGRSQHFVLAVDYNGNDIIVNDPWTGQRVAFSSKLFGSGNSATDIIGTHYFGRVQMIAPPPPPQQEQSAVAPNEPVPEVEPAPPGESKAEALPITPSLKPDKLTIEVPIG